MQVQQNHETGKLPSTSVAADIDVLAKGNRLCIYDKDTRECYLIDTGAEVSVLAYRGREIPSTNTYKLFAANNTPIKTYGERTIEVNLGLRRTFKWTFIIADVKTSILGADFLNHYKLLVDVHNQRLMDQETNLSVNAIRTNVRQQTIHVLSKQQTYYEILKQYPELFRPVSHISAAKHNVTHHIETTGLPLYAKARPLTPEKYQAVKKEFEKMMEMGICQPSKSSWASPIHVVTKKDGSYRICGDYRRLNAMTVPDRYPIPRMQDFTYQLHNKKIFTKLDLKSAFYWIPMDNPEKTAVITPFGLFEFRVMPFGLRNASQTFQRFMHEVLRGIEGCFPYIDDILLYSEDEKSHKELLHQVLKRLSDYGIALSLEKCEFGKTKIDFLGYKVSADGISPPTDRIQAISSYKKPKDVQELRRFLGMINFYRDCLPKQAELQHELNKYLQNTKKNDKTPIEWTEKSNNAFEKCRQSILNATTLSHPVHGAPLSIMTDASDVGLGAVLQQKVNNRWKPLAFYSKSMSPTQRRYSVYDRELLAIYTAVKHFRRLIEGNDVTVQTDHKPLSFALSKPSSNSDTPRRERQLSFISQFCSKIEYLEGKQNTVADWLSRIEEISIPSAIDIEQLARDQNQDDELCSLKNKKNLTFNQVWSQNHQQSITCEMTTGNPRPYLPKRYRYEAYKAIHDLCHPGVRTTRKLVAEKYFWPGMNKDLSQWARACLSCQRSKIHRHTITPLGEFPPSSRFEHVHIDIVGPLPPSNNKRYCVTMIDRFTKWPEVVPVHEITAEVVAKAFYDGWISRFGCPLRITTDQGRQFESDLFHCLMTKLGIKRIRTTPYHPQANGQIERFHRTLKAAIMARETSNSWANDLPTVLLGLRTSLRLETKTSPCLLTYGTQLRVPADFFVPTAGSNYDESEYVKKLTKTMTELSSEQKTKYNQKPFVHQDLATCTHVFVRNDSVQPPLSQPYEGPYEVIQRYEKKYKIQLPRRTAVISLDRLKPAYLYNSDAATEISDEQRQKPSKSSSKNNESRVPYRTKSGRTVKPTAYSKINRIGAGWSGRGTEINIKKQTPTNLVH